MNELILVYASISFVAMLILPVAMLIFLAFYYDKKINIATYKIIISAAFFLVCAFVFNELLNYTLGFKLLELIVIFHIILAGYMRILPAIKHKQKKKRGKKK